MFEVIARECHLSFILTPVQKKIAVKHLGNSRSSLVIKNSSLINILEISALHWWKSAMTISKVVEFLPWKSLAYCYCSRLHLPECIGRKLSLVILGLHQDLTCHSCWTVEFDDESPVFEALSAPVLATSYYLLIQFFDIGYSTSHCVPVIWNSVEPTDWNTLLAEYAAVIFRF